MLLTRRDCKAFTVKQQEHNTFTVKWLDNILRSTYKHTTYTEVIFRSSGYSRVHLGTQANPGYLKLLLGSLG